jgi:hypothetical protein
MATAEQLPGDLDVEVIQGDYLSLQFSADVNYSGYSFISEIHELHGGAVTCLTVLSAGSSTSWVQVDVTSAQTGALAITTDEGSHNWRIDYTDTSGHLRTWIKGAFTVLTKI